MKASRVTSTGRAARWAIAAGGSDSRAPGGHLLARARSDERNIPRRPDGRPDLTGTYDIATLTPVERPPEYGDKLTLSDEEAAAIGDREMQMRVLQDRPSDPDREAPPEGGDGSPGAAGNVGGYDFFWIDRGEGAFKIDGKWRTSIIVDPPNGRYPPLSEEGRLRSGASRAVRARQRQRWNRVLDRPGGRALRRSGAAAAPGALRAESQPIGAAGATRPLQQPQADHPDR